ncbi:MAG: phosphatase PAP2 family protein [Candidatus Thiothrix singaporensis]|uniref:Phosphatase PAP2 family protein n=1 Tax=Candidatus Thiothrix singaporensis TaxID=2799669 RepID=A0A7L6ATI0_9GAMM|nr:MAG: phosphatase PAP2 family protein [Candidatus Thiothrix singaporensis]
MRDELETIGVPVLLMLLLAATIGVFSLNTVLFLGMQQWFALWPDAVWENITLLGDALVALALLGLLAFRHPQLLPAGLLAPDRRLAYPQPEIPAGDGEATGSIGQQAHIAGIELQNFSFPSGHTAAAFVVAGVYALVLQRERLTALLYSAALLVGCSRIAVGAHWPWMSPLALRAAGFRPGRGGNWRAAGAGQPPLAGNKRWWGYSCSSPYCCFGWIAAIHRHSGCKWRSRRLRPVPASPPSA